MDKEEETTYYFNDGRLSCDNKWIKAIDERIDELERQVGIPELKRLKKVVKYGWEHEHKAETKPTQKTNKENKK